MGYKRYLLSSICLNYAAGASLFGSSFAFSSISLLSALAFLALAAFCLLFTGKHTAVVSLQELGSLVKRIRLFPLLHLLPLNDLVKVLPTALLLDALRPLLLDLSEFLLLVLKVSLGLVALLVLLAHLLIIGL